MCKNGQKNIFQPKLHTMNCEEQTILMCTMSVLLFFDLKRKSNMHGEKRLLIKDAMCVIIL